MTPSEIEAAYHEAGHAVCCVMLGGRVTSVDIIRTDGRAGLTRFIPPRGIVEKIAVDLAGAAAEHDRKLRRGERYDGTAAGDLSSTDAELRNLHGWRWANRQDCPEFIEGEKLAKAVVGDCWGAVKRLAEWLVIHKQASGAMALAIVASHNLAKRERQKPC